VSILKTFGTMGKQQRELNRSEETELFRHESRGFLTHMWFGGGHIKTNENCLWPAIRIVRRRAAVEDSA